MPTFVPFTLFVDSSDQHLHPAGWKLSFIIYSQTNLMTITSFKIVQKRLKLLFQSICIVKTDKMRELDLCGIPQSM